MMVINFIIIIIYSHLCSISLKIDFLYEYSLFIYFIYNVLKIKFSAAFIVKICKCDLDKKMYLLQT